MRAKETNVVGKVRVLGSVGTTLLLLCAATLPKTLHAKTSTTLCPVTETYFEFQVTTPARWIRDTTEVHPLPYDQKAPTIIQFVVDTTGTPDLHTFKVIKSMDPNADAEARQAASNWRYQPATLDDCKVRQLVQTGVGR